MKHFILPLLCASLLSGCALTTAGIKKGDERNFARSLNDVNAGRVIEARMKRAYDFDLGGIDVEVAEGVVLLSGNVPTKEDRIEAARIAWSAPRIDQVGNEVMIKGKQGFIRNTKDGILEKAVRTRLIADNAVKARNFNIETHDGIVYLLGVARTQEELERAAQIAAQTRGTAEVISYARIADLPQQQRLSQQENYQSVERPTQRQLPDFLTTEPPAAQQPAAPIQSAPLDQPIPFNRPSQEATGPTAPPMIDMGDRLGKEFPSDEELGAYRTGAAGEAVSIIESEPYYIDPDTGEQIPVSFVNGVVVPKVIK
jgi:osmotically-inducible protein OsmY